MTLKPNSDYILCKKTSNDFLMKDYFGFTYQDDCIEQYQIIDISDRLKGSQYKVNDQILINSIPTKVRVDDSLMYLVKEENVIGVIS